METGHSPRHGETVELPRTLQTMDQQCRFLPPMQTPRRCSSVRRAPCNDERGLRVAPDRRDSPTPPIVMRGNPLIDVGERKRHSRKMAVAIVKPLGLGLSLLLLGHLLRVKGLLLPILWRNPPAEIEQGIHAVGQRLLSTVHLHVVEIRFAGVIDGVLGRGTSRESLLLLDLLLAVGTPAGVGVLQEVVVGLLVRDM